MTTPFLPQPKPSDTVADDTVETDPAEQRAIAAEVRHDLENDNRPERHFEDLLDQMHTSASRAQDTGLPSREEQAAAELLLRQFCQAIDRGVTEAVAGDGLRVRHVTAQEDCIAAVVEDRLGNGWQASCSFATLERDLERYGDGPAFVQAQVAKIVGVVRQARARWWTSGGRA